MKIPRPVIDVGFRLLNVLHRSVLRASGGRLGARAFGMPAIELVTVGRRSGLARSTMLTAPVVEGQRLVLVASKGGDDRDPDWYRNAVAHPQVEVVRSGVRTAMLARTATPDEAEELWPRIVASYGPYAGYRRRARREIPLVICDPR